MNDRSQPNLTVLGLETSCDETAAAVVRVGEDGVRVLSSVVASQIDDHAPFGGVVPEIAARAHVQAIDGVIAKAMADAGVDFSGLDGVAATAGPGLVGGVMVGLSAGKAIALARGLPLIAVNHLEGHALSVRLTEPVDYPFLLLLVSGGHCQLLIVQGVGACRRLGSTIDDAAGEAFDKIAKSLGLPYPGGPALERLAEDGDPDKFPLPRALLGRKDCDFSFSGLKTAVAQLVAGYGSGALPRQFVADVAASFQAAVGDIMADRLGHALAMLPEASSVIIAGGVAANLSLRARLAAVTAERGKQLIAPPQRLCTDNAVMVAWAGIERLRLGISDPLSTPCRPRWPLDSL